MPKKGSLPPHVKIIKGSIQLRTYVWQNLHPHSITPRPLVTLSSTTMGALLCLLEARSHAEYLLTPSQLKFTAALKGSDDDPLYK